MIKNHYPLLIIFGIIIFLNSCKHNQTQLEISANLSGFMDDSKVILMDITSQKIIDSTWIANNTFNLHSKLDDHPTLLNITIKTKEDKTLTNTNIFVGNEKIVISGDKNDFPNGIKLTGSKYHSPKAELDSLTKSLNEERKINLQNMFSLRQEGKWNDSLQHVYWSKTGLITQIDDQYDQILKDFITQNINSEYALSQLVGNKNSFSKGFIQQQIERLNPALKKTKYAAVLTTFLQYDTLEKNDSYYDFKAQNKDGKLVSFSDFFNKKPVLLEFYLPYCSWCIKALPEIKKLSKSNKDDLEIVTFNLCRTKKDWLKTNASKEADWTSLWDEKGKYSEAFTKYNASGTPAYYLFDKDGKLLEKWGGYDKNLISQIKEMIK